MKNLLEPIPCKTCGLPHETRLISRHIIDERFMFKPNNSFEVFAVQCGLCGEESGDHEDDEKAIEEWNKIQNKLKSLSESIP